MTSFPTVRRFISCLVMIAAPASAMQAEPAIIAKARAYLGSEDALNGVKNVHYTGTMVTPNPVDPAKPSSLFIDIVFQLPDQQRSIRTTPTLVDTVALNGYDGWHRVQEIKNPKHVSLKMLNTNQIRRQRFLVEENLGFYRAITQTGGKVEDMGSVMQDGVACRKIAFIHAPDMIFYRYFDEATGRLILSETESGGTIREEGEIKAGGIRFPQKITNSAKSASGKIESVTIIFDSVTVNENFPDSTFANPIFSGK